MLLLFLSACQLNSDSVLSTINIKTNGHVKQLHDYDSPYTACYENNDGTYSFYIFASPIQFRTRTGAYEVIDNTVIESNISGFAYENKAGNVKTYFPKLLADQFRVEKDTDYIEFKADWNVDGFSEATHTIFVNMYGDKVDAVVYKREDMDAVFYPTKSGIKTEIILKEKLENCELHFKVKSSALSYENKQNGYILFKNGNEIVNVIYRPLVQYTTDKDAQFDVTTQMDVIGKGDECHVEMILDKSFVNDEESQYPIKLDPAFEMYLNKMPDSTVYSGYDINNYLANYAVVGEHPLLGEGWHYVRFRLNWFMELNSTEIKKATYNARFLSSNKKKFKLCLFNMNEQWSSTGILWENRAQDFTEYCEDSLRNHNYIHLDVTKFIKESFDDKSWTEESNGLVLKAKDSKAFTILATSDNSLYPPYIQIDMKSLPTIFDPQDNINPPE